MIFVQKKEVLWDLSEMFQSTTDPLLQKAIDDLTTMAQNFASRYQGKIKDLGPNELLECIKLLEEYYAKLDTIDIYSGLSFAANMTLPDTQSLNDRVSKAKAKLDKVLAFLKIELGSLVSKRTETIDEPILTNYRHFLEKLRREVPHQLSIAEEKLIVEKDQFGIRAWSELQEKWLGTREFEVEVEGKRKTVSLGEAYGLTFHPDRPTRESAAKSIYGLLGKDGEIFASALRNICNDWLNVCDTRKYPSPMEASLIANDIDRRTINNLMWTVEKNTGLYQQYLRLRARIMKLPKLGSHDLFAPIPNAPKMKFDYETVRTQIIKAYSRFDEDYAFAVRDMFVRNHIDSTPRIGKGNGAFCAIWLEGKTAYILINLSESLIDVYLLVHELGHATHAYYYTRSRTILNCGVSGFSARDFPKIVAETGSIFGELLLTDLLLSQTASNEERKAILCGVLDSASVIFRATSLAIFEQSLYDTIKHGGYLDYRTICKLWVAARDKVSGDAIEYFDEDEARWTDVPQYYMPNFRFYNYPYTYAQLFVYALYQKYLEEGKGFVPKFKKALSAGCSISPVEIGQIVGLDATDVHFWERGLKQYEDFVIELEKIAV